MSPESLPHGGSGLKGDSLRRCGASCHGKGLAGFAKTTSWKGSCRGGLLRLLCSLWSWSWRHSASPELRPYLGSPPLPCLVWWCPWLRLPVHNYRGTKSVPLFLYTDKVLPVLCHIACRPHSDCILRRIHVHLLNALELRWKKY